VVEDRLSVAVAQNAAQRLELAEQMVAGYDKLHLTIVGTRR
jgi:hypothetical protein